MSNALEIEEAIARLSAAERDALESRLFTRRFGLDDGTDQERQELSASLDEADQKMDAGYAHSANELRHSVQNWAGK